MKQATHSKDAKPAYNVCVAVHRSCDNLLIGDPSLFSSWCLSWYHRHFCKSLTATEHSGKQEWLLHNKWNMQVVSPSDIQAGSSNANNDYLARCNFPLPRRFCIFYIQSTLAWLELGLFKFTGELALPVLNLCQPQGVSPPRFSNLPGTKRKSNH